MFNILSIIIVLLIIAFTYFLIDNEFYFKVNLIFGTLSFLVNLLVFKSYLLLIMLLIFFIANLLLSCRRKEVENWYEKRNSDEF